MRHNAALYTGGDHVHSLSAAALLQNGASRDVLLLDIALDNWFRTQVRKQLRIVNSPHSHADWNISIAPVACPCASSSSSTSDSQYQV